MKIITCTAGAFALVLAACGGYTPIGEGEPMGGSSGTGGTSTMTGGTGGSSTMTGGSGGSMPGSGATGGAMMSGGTGGTGMMTGGTGGTMPMGGTGGTGMYEPCENRACGTACSVCAPDDMNCAADAVLTYCDAGGNCSPTFPMCPTNTCEDFTDCPVIDIACQMCSDGSTACPNVECLMGQCVTSYPTCPGQACMTAEECPVSDAPCTMCADGTTVCPWSDCVNNVCTSGIDSCGTKSPCEGKSCGDYCTPCAGSNCDAAAPIMAASYCDANLDCVYNVPMCSTKECTLDTDCPGVELCMPCANAAVACASVKCVEGSCQLECPMDQCGGCGEEERCIYQIGGPGPSHYVCAKQSPCGSAATCACIQEQGVCGQEPVDGYCQCDNGLE
jgi:hypothetical protein